MKVFISYSLENIFSVFKASFSAFEIANWNVICLSTNYFFLLKQLPKK